MSTQIVDLNHFHQKARQIRARVPAILAQWGLPQKFSRWRLTQDPDSGMVVLFAMLNTRFIAAHTATPFSDYFDPRLLNDLANDLQLQVVSCNSDGLRYAFILDRGQIDVLPTHIDYPFRDGDKLFVRVVYGDKPASAAREAVNTAASPGQHAVGAFLNVFSDIKLREVAAPPERSQEPPIVVVVEAEKFNQRVAEYNEEQRRRSQIKRLFNKPAP